MAILKDLLSYKDLLYMLTVRNIKIRFKQAAMGFIWAIFMPMVAVLAGIVIKKAISVVSGKPMDFAGVISISVKVLPWTFFVSSIKFSVQSLVGNVNLVNKIYFPREVLPFSSILACLFDFMIATSTLSILLIFARIGVSIYLLWVPLLLLILILFTAGLGLIFSCANLFFRDVKYIVETILMFGIFFTPVFFDAHMFGRWEIFLLINPVGSILEAINAAVVLHQMPNLFWVSYAAVVSILVFVVGFIIFHKSEPLFAENI
ncbi:MAG: ABC transporter permease [Candidatus Omnitrophota bacterium]